MPYRVYHLNVYVKSFRTRDDALRFILSQTKRQDNYYFAEDFEILDGSDFL
jgi:hypothetical protein